MGFTERDGPLAQPTTRRAFLKYGAAGLTTAGLAGTALARWPGPTEAAAQISSDGVLELFVNDGFVPMVDQNLVYMRGFGAMPTNRDDAHPSLTIEPVVFSANGVTTQSRSFPLGGALPKDERDGNVHHGRPTPLRRDLDDPEKKPVHIVRRQYWASFFPRRTIIAEEGATMKLRITNRLKETHRFAVDGPFVFKEMLGPDAELPPNKLVPIEFDVPFGTAGTYIYHDPTNAPVERVLGLYGVLVVVPSGAQWNVTADTAEFERQWLWICHDIDSEWARRAAMGATIDPQATPPVPDYFTLNDRSGFFSLAVSTNEEINRLSHEETLAAGYARRTDVRNFSKEGTADGVITGQALRLVNAGIAMHQLHWHGNHVWTQRKNRETFGRSTHEQTVDDDGHIRLQQWEDVVEIDPLDRKDMILPFKPPPDVLREILERQACDWHYPMHCHAEMSQTAKGGLYPGGLVADWILAPPLGA